MSSARVIFPTKKTDKCVLPMLYFALLENVMRSYSKPLPLISMHEDIYVDKINRLSVIYLCWRVFLGLHKNVQLSLMQAGSPKNYVGGSLVHVKSYLKKWDIWTSWDFMQVVENSLKNKICIPFKSVYWRLWKDLKESYFNLRSTFSKTKYHTLPDQRKSTCL